MKNMKLYWNGNKGIVDCESGRNWVSLSRGQCGGQKSIAGAVLLVLLFVLAFSYALPPVSAFGIQHTQTEIYSDQTKHFEGEFWIVNDDHENMELEVGVEGALEDYVALEKDKVKFMSSDEIKAVRFKIDIPESLPPGETVTYITVSQKFNADKGNVIESRIMLKHAITVYGPLPDKYIKAKLNFRENNDKVELISEVKNMGKKKISSVKTLFTVNGIEQESPIATEEKSLDVHETKLLKAELDRDKFTNGEYKVSAVTTYDGFQVETTKSMRIGKPVVEVVYFDKYFIYNQINKYIMDLENKWNQQIENVYVDVTVLKDNKTIDSFRTPSVNIQGLMIKRVSDYFDATGKPKGEYAFDMVVHFWNTYKMEKKRFYSKIISPEEYKVAEVKDNFGKLETMMLYNIPLLILIAGGLVYIIWRLRKK